MTVKKQLTYGAVFSSMDHKKVAQFIELAGQKAGATFTAGSPEQRKLGAQLLLSEVLEYIIKGLGVTPSFNGEKITDAEGLLYEISKEPSKLEMIDGLADTAYTMYWNSVTFGAPLEEAFELVCDNNLEKFVRLDGWSRGATTLGKEEWSLGLEVTWPKEVETVSVINSGGSFFAVGKDKNGKVRKPSSYQSVVLSHLAA